MTVSSVTPGVVLKTKFATSNLKAYQEYVDYVDREDAKKEYGAHEKLFTFIKITYLILIKLLLYLRINLTD